MVSKLLKEAFEFMKVLIIAFILIWVINNFIAVTYNVEGKSMDPTLEDGEKLVVNIADYLINGVDRFDTIVFHANDKEDYVKRVIGLPGDSIYYKNDVLYINGEPVNEDYLVQSKYFNKNLHLTEDFTLDSITGEERVPEGKYFVMGDNRLVSYDSRRFGFIDKNQIVGKVEFIYWPIRNFHSVK